MSHTFPMERNVGKADRYLRIMAGSFLLAASAARMAREPDLGGTLLGLIGGMALAEGILGTCPLYTALGINTNHDSPPPGQRTNDVIQPYEGI